MKQIAAVIVLLLCACRSTQPVPSRAGVVAEVRVVKVALFPYIPDAADDKFAKLIAWLDTEFEKQNEGIDIQITMNGALSPYDPAIQAQLYSADGFQAVEIDALVLGQVLQKGYISPVVYERPQAFPFTTNASAIEGTTYLIPTWVCMNFFMLGEGMDGPFLSGTWDGSFSLPSNYLTAVADLKGYGAVGAAVKTTADPDVVAEMSKMMTNCTGPDAKNNCLNGTFKAPPGEAQRAFVAGHYRNTSGFSESTFYVLKAEGKKPKNIEPLQVTVTGTNRPLAFTDGLTVNRAACAGQCVDDVYRFAAFLNDAKTLEYICFSGDAPGGPPRYLSPAVQAFYEGPAKDDVLYKMFHQGFTTAQTYPNTGIPDIKKDLNTALCTELKKTISDACGPQ